MRVSAHIVFAALAAVVAGVHAQVARPAPETVLAAAREALGGNKRLSAVKSFTATGRTRQVSGDNLVPIEFEIACELPDRYVRKDEVPARESEPTSVGFDGIDLSQLPPPPPPPPPRAGGPPAPPAAQLDRMRSARLTTVKQDFVRLTLGMFAASFSSYPLTFSYVGTAEAPQGKADVLDVKGPDNFAGRFFVNKETHLPIMISWQVSGRGGGPPPMGAPPGAAPAPPKPVEHRIYYAEYRDVDGLQFPFRLRRAVAGETVEETTFDRFRINPKIDPRKFEVRK
jgi:hypothetical protein